MRFSTALAVLSAAFATASATILETRQASSYAGQFLLPLTPCLNKIAHPTFAHFSLCPPLFGRQQHQFMRFQRHRMFVQGSRVCQYDHEMFPG